MTKKTKTRAFTKAKNLIRYALLSIFALSLLQPAIAYNNDLSDDIRDDDLTVTNGTAPPSSWEKWLYYDRGDHISVCGYTGTEGRITIPSEIDGKPVTEISSRNTGTAESPQYKFFEDYNGTAASVIVPEGVLSIAPYAFSDSFILKTIILPESLRFIGNHAFAYCQQLTSIDIPEGVRGIGIQAFAQTGLTEIDLPEGLKIIGEGAFMASALTQVHIPDSVIYIGKEVFYSTYIEEIKLPAGLKKLESYLLSGCIRLKRVYISEGTEIMDSYVFESCPNLEDVYFPSTLKEFNAIFSYNQKLKNLYFAADEKQTGLTVGTNILDKLIRLDEPDYNLTYYYENVRITYNTPAPVTEESNSQTSLNIDKTTMILIAASTVCLTLSAVFLILFIKGKKQTEAAKAERAKREEEGFRPEVLGAWKCEKCGTMNSSIGNYCYKCGRKR